MKIALITDTHQGARNDSKIIDDYFNKFFTDIFFPYVDEHNIKTVIHCGDAFDRRKYINFNTLERAIGYLYNPIKERNIDLHLIAGNHDCYFKNTNVLNSPNLLLDKYNFSIYYGPGEHTFDGLKVAFLPWIASDNYKESMEFLEKTDARFVFSHLELAGFEMHRGSVSTHGMEKNIFNKFDTVVSGHYHTKSRRDNIFYLGTAYEMTWADYNDPKGFHVFDTETQTFEFIKNPYTIFKKIQYNDKDKMFVMDFETEDVSNAYVKVMVQEKTNPFLFEQFVEQLEKQNPAQLQIVENSIYLNDYDDEILDGWEDTPTLLKKYCEQVESNLDKEELYQFLNTLYIEASEITE